MSSHQNSTTGPAIVALQNGHPEEAIRLCRQILASNNRDVGAWSVLGVALARTNGPGVLEALSTAVELDPGNVQSLLNYGIALHQTGNFVEAEAACRGAFEKSRGALETLEPLANCLAALNRFQEAAELLRAALKHQHGPDVHRKLAYALAQTGDPRGAVDQLRDAGHGQPPTANDRFMMANLEAQLQHFDVASDLFDGLLREFPTNPDIAVSAAQLKRTLGQTGTADAILASAHAANKEHFALTAALLEADTVEQEVIETAERMMTTGAGPVPARRAVAFALARYFDRADAVDKAWHFVTLANSLYDDNLVWRVEGHEAQLQAALRLYETVAPLEADGSDPRQIYLIGPPRSGGTLLQTLLSAAPGVVSVGERGALLSWIGPIVLSNERAMGLWAEKAGELRAADIAGLRQLHPDAAQYVDKTTHNAHIAGLLQRLHPGAALVDCRRNPCDMAVSILFQDFPGVFSYSRNLADIAGYLVFQRKLVDAWRNAGVSILDHDHESFIRDPQSVAGLFAELGLPFDPAWLGSEHRRASAVQTFSTQRVREELSTDHSGTWERYRDFIGDLPERLAGL